MTNVEKLNSCLEYFGSLRIDSLRNRKILQKRVYFLQVFGVNLGYNFGWYIYGPYSSELAHDTYSLSLQKSVAPETIEDVTLDRIEQENITKLKEFLKEYDRPDNNYAYWLELLASIHFLNQEAFISNKTKDSIIAKLKEKKGNKFEDKDINEAWEYLQNYHLINI